MNLYCKKCNHKITTTDLLQAPSTSANLKDKAELINTGLYLIAEEIEINFKQDINFLVNIKSVNLHNHKDPKKLTGCCGAGDLSVLNQVCPNCSAEIGVIVEDCWIPHFIGISEATVSKKPMW